MSVYRIQTDDLSDKGQWSADLAVLVEAADAKPAAKRGPLQKARSSLMLDIHGRTIRVGDQLKVGGEWTVGVVVCSIDTGVYSSAYPEEAWSYLKRGIVVDTEKAGLIHYVENDDELEIIASNSN